MNSTTIMLFFVLKFFIFVFRAILIGTGLFIHLNQEDISSYIRQASELEKEASSYINR